MVEIHSKKGKNIKLQHLNSFLSLIWNTLLLGFKRESFDYYYFAAGKIVHIYFLLFIKKAKGLFNFNLKIQYIFDSLVRCNKCKLD